MTLYILYAQALNLSQGVFRSTLDDYRLVSSGDPASSANSTFAGLFSAAYSVYYYAFHAR